MVRGLARDPFKGQTPSPAEVGNSMASKAILLPTRKRAALKSSTGRPGVGFSEASARNSGKTWAGESGPRAGEALTSKERPLSQISLHPPSLARSLGVQPTARFISAHKKSRGKTVFFFSSFLTQQYENWRKGAGRPRKIPQRQGFSTRARRAHQRKSVFPPGPRRCFTAGWALRFFSPLAACALGFFANSQLTAGRSIRPGNPEGKQLCRRKFALHSEKPDYRCLPGGPGGSRANVQTGLVGGVECGGKSDGSGGPDAGMTSEKWRTVSLDRVGFGKFAWAQGGQAEGFLCEG